MRVAYFLWGPAYGLGDGWVEVAVFPLSSEDTVDPDLGPTYTDELTLGYDHRVSDEVAASVTLIWREQHDAINATNNQEPTARWTNVGNPDTFGLPSAWQPPRSYQLGAKLEL